MKFKKSSLVTAVAALIGVGAVGQAGASIYGLSHVKVDDLSLVITDNQGNLVPVNNFNFSMTNTADLNGAPAIDTSNCSGLLAPPSGSCNPTFPGGSGANTVLGGTTDLATGAGAGPNVVNAPASVPLRTEDVYTFLGPGLGEYGNADSVIYDAALVGDPVTQTEQIAENELQTGASASAGSTIQSATSLNFDFTILPGSSGELILDFTADPDLRARIDTPPPDDAAFATAQADLTWRFTLSQDTGGNGFIQWSPQGTAATNDCAILFSGAVCTETADTQDLNNTVGVSTLPNSEDLYSFEVADVQTAFGIEITGIEEGTWTLTLFEQTQTNVTLDTLAVPEPSTLLLLGGGIAGMGFLGRRGKKRT